MKKIYNYRKIEEDNSDIYAMLIDLVERDDFESFLNLSKLFNVFESQSNKNRKLINKASNLIKGSKKEENIRSWEQVLETQLILKSWTDQLFSSDDYKSTLELSTEDNLAVLLITTELIASYFNSLRLSQFSDNKANEQMIQFDHALKKVFENDNFEKGHLMYENLAKCTTSILKHLYHSDKCDEISISNVNKPYDFENIEIAINNQLSADKYRFISDFKNEFKYSNLIISKKGGNSDYELKNYDSSFMESYHIYLSRVKTIESQHEAEFFNKILRNPKYLDVIDSKTKSLHGISSININELYSYIELVYNLFVDDLNVQGEIHNISSKSVNIRQLLRAYSVLVQISKDYLDNTDNSSDCCVSNTCIVISKKELRKHFTNGGIEYNDCNQLIEVLTFNRSIQNADITDCPLIPINNKFVIIPSICSVTNIYKAIMSRVNQFEFQGEEFENILIKRLSTQNINAIKKKINVNNEEYQCDLMFCIDDELFICECKAWGDVSTLAGYYELEIKKQDACKQLNRISNFYTNNLHHIQSDFTKDKTWKPNKTHRLLITNTMTGDNQKIDGVMVIDYSYFDKFLKREKPMFVDSYNGNKTLSGFDDFDGEISLEKLVNFLNSDANLKLQKARTREDMEKISLFDNSLEFKVFRDVFSNHKISLGEDSAEYHEFVSNLEALELI